MPAEPLNEVTGTAQGVGDTLRGTSGDDKVSGLSGDDVMRGGRGDDQMIGGQGNDVMFGGVGADTFVWSAGHIGDGEVDYVADFSLRQGDSLKFLDSASADFEVLSVEIQGVEATEANGVDLRNRQVSDNDIVFTVYNATTDSTQEIVLLDAWSRGMNDDWEAVLAEMGLVFGDNTGGEEYVECEDTTHLELEELEIVQVAPTDDFILT